MLALIFEHISGTNLRAHGRPVQEAAALLLAVLCQLVATRNRTTRGWRGRAPLLDRLRRGYPPVRTGVALRSGCCHPHRASRSVKSGSLRRFTSQHVELMTKREDLCLQRRPRPEQSDQRQPNQAANISHQPRASPNSTSLASLIEFPTVTRIS
jgi:hypothetical protein